MYHVYILRCQDGTLYTGITNDLERRLAQHKAGNGGSYTRAKKADKIVYSEQAAGRGDAQKREAEIKGWSREKKLALCKQER